MIRITNPSARLSNGTIFILYLVMKPGNCEQSAIMYNHHDKMLQDLLAHHAPAKGVGLIKVRIQNGRLGELGCQVTLRGFDQLHEEHV